MLETLIICSKLKEVFNIVKLYHFKDKISIKSYQKNKNNTHLSLIIIIGFVNSYALYLLV